MSRKTIKDYRKCIDDLDKRIVRLLDERTLCAKKIGEIKKLEGKKIVVKSREVDVIRNAKKVKRIHLDDRAVETIYRAIIAASTRVESE